MNGGSVLKTDRTYERQRSDAECGLQPPEEPNKFATQSPNNLNDETSCFDKRTHVVKRSTSAVHAASEMENSENTSSTTAVEAAVTLPEATLCLPRVVNRHLLLHRWS